MNAARERRHENWIKKNYLPGLESALTKRERELKGREKAR